MKGLSLPKPTWPSRATEHRTRQPSKDDVTSAPLASGCASGNLVRPRRPWSPERPRCVSPAFRTSGTSSFQAGLRHRSSLAARCNPQTLCCVMGPSVIQDRSTASKQRLDRLASLLAPSPCTGVVLPALGNRLNQSAQQSATASD